MMIRRNSDIEVYLPDASAEQETTVAADCQSEEDTLMSSENPPVRRTLPPHLAARFYQRSNARRRPSVPSASRRSSVSSLHSNISSHSDAHTGNIAQHLRRASIIESRKARLADRAAHAEKVRLRATIAKDVTKSAVKAERAQAAQRARERVLADITSKCEEEVRRAKKKAEDTKERKAAEHARLRLEMAEKLAEADRRRLLYQQTSRRPRSATITTAEEKGASKPNLNKEVAARIIQKAWQNYHARVIVNNYSSVKLSLERIRLLSFEEVGALLAEERVLSATSKVLKLCGLQDIEGGAIGARGAVRIFLSSYLILAHPAQVLSGNGEQEQDLIEKARDLLVIFEQVMGQLSLVGISSVSLSTDLQALSESYNMFFSAFHAWKSRDSTVLIDIMLAQFVELELIWQTVKHDDAGGAADDYQQGIRQNQVLLLARLKRLAGSEKAMEMVKRALKKAKQGKRRNKASAQAIPRALGTPSASPDITPDKTSPLDEVFTNPEQQRRRPEHLNEKIISPQDRFTKALTALPDNRTLVHELLINSGFSIDQGPYTEIRRQIMQHICDTMRKDVESGLGTNWTVAMATVIQDKLLRSLKPGNSLYNIISEVLDPTYVENQCNAGTFSYEAFFDFMSNILPRLCAPYRDPEVKKFSEDKSGDAIDRLARLMGIIDLLSLDHTNFMLQMAAPQLIEDGPGYEQRAFSRDVQNGTINLERTRTFWRSSRSSIVSDMKKRDAWNAGIDTQPSIAKIYAQGLVDLVLCNGPLPRERLPETLDLDYGRFEHLRSQSFKIAATAAILLSAKNLLKRDVRSQWKTEADRILSLDFKDIKPERVQSILDSNHPMPTATRSQLLSTIKRVLTPATAASITAATTKHPDTIVSTDGQAPSPAVSQNISSGETEAESFTNPVARLMLARLRAHILAQLSAVSARERVRATSTASQSLADVGMPEFVSDVCQIVDSLNKVREVDWMCHEMVYEKVLGEDTEEGPGGLVNPETAGGCH